MLTKKDVEKLICNRFGYLSLLLKTKILSCSSLGGATDAYLAIRFELNGEITFPTHLAFNPPEYSRWDFDEEKQEILIFDTDNQLRIRGKLPTKWLSNSVQIQLFDGVDGILVHSPRFDASQVTERTLGERICTLSLDKLLTWKPSTILVGKTSISKYSIVKNLSSFFRSGLRIHCSASATRKRCAC